MRPEAMLDLKARLGREEGVEYKSYLDSKGFPTGGEGHLLNAAERARCPIGTPIPAEVVNDWFAQDFATANSSLAQMLRAHYKFDLYALPDTVQEALVDLTFNMGATRLCGFGNTLRLIYQQTVGRCSGSSAAECRLGEDGEAGKGRRDRGFDTKGSLGDSGRDDAYQRQTGPGVRLPRPCDDGRQFFDMLFQVVCTKV